MDIDYHEFVKELPGALMLLARNLLASMILVAVVVVVYRLLVLGLYRLRNRRALSEQLTVLLRLIARWLAVGVCLLIVLQKFGLLENAWSTMTAMLAVVGVGFVATWSVVSNTFCSVVLLMSRPFEVGDTVELVPDNVRGKVVNFTLLFTTLRDAETGETSQIPNNLFFQKAIRMRHGTRRVGLDVQLDREDATDELQTSV